MTRRPQHRERLRKPPRIVGRGVLTLACDDQHRPLTLAWLEVSWEPGTWRGEVHPQAVVDSKATTVVREPSRGTVGKWWAERGPLDVRCHRCGFHLRVRGEDLHRLAVDLAERGMMPGTVTPRFVAEYVRRARG